MTALVLKIPFQEARQKTACDFLAEQSGLSKARIKDAMNKGGVWLKKAKKTKHLRLRRAATALKKGDHLDLYYDEKILARTPPQATLLKDAKHYSLWYKPAGLLTQGTKYSDHCSLLRQVEKSFTPARPVFLVHRLDRETSGIIIIAHTSNSAGKLAELFRKNLIKKEYRATLRGFLDEVGAKGIMDQPLDGKNAFSEYEILEYSQPKNETVVAVFIQTGRTHQIRRHFAEAGFPLMGDPKYGRNNKNRQGLQLVAFALAFPCPFTGKSKKYCLTDFNFS